MKKFVCIILISFFLVLSHFFHSITPLQSQIFAQLCGNTVLVGENSSLHSTGDLPVNVWKSIRLRASRTGTVTCFKVFLKELPDSPGHRHNLGYALYTNNNSAYGGCSQPGQLIAYGNRSNYDWSVVGANQWHDFPLTQTASVTAGTFYWIALCSDGGHDGWHFGRASSSNDPGHTARKRGCNTHSWNDIPQGSEWNIVYPDTNAPCSDEGTYSWYFASGSSSYTSTTTTIPTGTTSVTSSINSSSTTTSSTNSSPTTTTSTNGLTTTSLEPTTTSSIETDLDIAFRAIPKYGFTPLTVEFKNLSTGPIARCEWHFGDGTTSSERDPVHTYTDFGIFNVKLFAYGIDGNIEITTQPNIIVTLLGCPISTLLDNQENISTLRLFRNHMLKNLFGLILVSLYYQNSDELLKTLITNPELNDRLDDLISENIHMAQTILNGNRTALPESTLLETIHLLEQFKKHGSRQLADDLTIVINLLSHNTILSHLGISVD